MVMSQGTYTFLTCFAGFWLVWALIVMLCCFCSFVQRRLKRRREERLREQSLRALEMDPLAYRGYPPREPPQFCAPPQGMPPQIQSPQPIPPGSWTNPQEVDVFSKPPCYEEAVLMEDPPPPYSEVLADSRAGVYSKPSRKPKDPETSKSTPEPVFPERAYTSLIHLPMSEHWDSLGRLLSTVDLNRNNLPSQMQARAPLHPTLPHSRRSNTNFSRGMPLPDRTYPLPTAFPLFGRSTAV
ncbi:proline-rich protein 7 [Amia ocellicauda]|uniref:proline-rich protein 7 n=1 Tax=Amia ocellicauda TaxID=2972642 RepID=UPI003463BA8C